MSFIKYSLLWWLPCLSIFSQEFLGSAGPLGEELGWRGFLTAQLNVKFNLYAVSIITGIIWAVWHLLLFVFDLWRGGLSISEYLPFYLCFTILVSSTMNLILKASQYSVIGCIIFHAVINSTTQFSQKTTWWEARTIPPLFDQDLSVFYYLVVAIVFAYFLKSTLTLSKENTRYKTLG